jgi:hypothetical protein
MAPKDYSEDDIADAIFAITDEGLSQNQAALRYGVPRSTIQSRLNDQKAEADQIQPNQRITHNKEIKIRNWALQQESLGYGLSHNQIRAGVKALLKQHWATGYPIIRSELVSKLYSSNAAIIRH